MSDHDLLFGYDEDRRWIWADDGDGWVIDLPASAALLLDRATSRGSTARKWLARGVVLEIGDGETNRSFGRKEIGELLIEAAEPLVGLTTGSSIDDDRLPVLAHGSALLAALLNAIGQPEDPDAPPDAELSAEVDVLARFCDECDAAASLRVQPRRDATFRLRWRELDRQIVDQCAVTLEDVLASGAIEGDAVRLFPSAHAGDEERNDEWHALAHDSLVSSKLAALAVMRELMAGTSCNETQLIAIVQSLNSIRLILGTRLDVDEEDGPRTRGDDESDAERYTYLGYLQHGIVDALATVFPPT